MKSGGSLFVFEHNPLNPMTQWIVKRCPFDEDAVLLRMGEARFLLRQVGFTLQAAHYINFFPNSGLFRKLIRFEPMLKKFPLGAQYYLRATC